jgi:hypothetical protein
MIRYALQGAECKCCATDPAARDTKSAKRFRLLVNFLEQFGE